jgi:hypothetical protein
MKIFIYLFFTSTYVTSPKIQFEDIFPTRNSAHKVACPQRTKQVVIGHILQWTR